MLDEAFELLAWHLFCIVVAFEEVLDEFCY